MSAAFGDASCRDDRSRRSRSRSWRCLPPHSPRAGSRRSPRRARDRATRTRLASTRARWLFRATSLEASRSSSASSFRESSPSARRVAIERFARTSWRGTERTFDGRRDARAEILARPSTTPSIACSRDRASWARTRNEIGASLTKHRVPAQDLGSSSTRATMRGWTTTLARGIDSSIEFVSRTTRRATMRMEQRLHTSPSTMGPPEVVPVVAVSDRDDDANGDARINDALDGSTIFCRGASGSCYARPLFATAYVILRLID